MEHLKPAIQINPSTELSPQEFQKMLHVWFEEKGLESDLRSHLRIQMINVLKNTVIGRNLSKPNFQASSLAKQAVNLILAEYFIQHNCHYTFSIFNTEVNLSSVLPECASIFQANKSEKWRFNKENVLNILELIGISKISTESAVLLDLYYNSAENDTILSCIITLLCNLTQKKYRESTINVAEYLNNIDLQKEDKFMLDIRRVMSTTKLPINEVNVALEKIRNNYLNKKKSIKLEYSKSLNELKEKTRLTEERMNETEKLKKLFEKKLIKLYAENSDLKLTIQELKENEMRLRNELQSKNDAFNAEINSFKLKQQTQKIEVDKSECLIKHCEPLCQKNSELLIELQSKNAQLLNELEIHKAEIANLDRNCKQLQSNFDNCQTRVTMLNSRFQHENGFSIPEAEIRNDKASNTNFDLSDTESITEEILKQARLKLKELEQESQEIDSRFNRMFS